MIKTSCLLLFVMSAVCSGWTQSAADLAQKFHHHEVFEIEPGVVMSAEFGPNGLVCEMHVEQTRFKGDVVDLTNGLDSATTDALLDRIVSASERGPKEEDKFSRLVHFSGSTMTKTDRYANVTVHVLSGLETHKKGVTITGPTVLEIKWRNRSCS